MQLCVVSVSERKKGMQTFGRGGGGRFSGPVGVFHVRFLPSGADPVLSDWRITWKN